MPAKIKTLWIQSKKIYIQNKMRYYALLQIILVAIFIALTLRILIALHTLCALFGFLFSMHTTFFYAGLIWAIASAFVIGAAVCKAWYFVLNRF